jgi:hypothetical protein
MCDMNLRCDNNLCAACGMDMQACCAGGACLNGGCCDHNQNGGTCVGATGMCSAMQGVCTANGCQNGMCGKAGQQCCGGGVGCTDALTDCVNNMCAACGHKGEPCCANKVCDQGRTCTGQNMCQ